MAPFRLGPSIEVEATAGDEGEGAFSLSTAALSFASCAAVAFSFSFVDKLAQASGQMSGGLRDFLVLVTRPLTNS